jgi:Omp85 superfamily domain/WD40-like Beta Propeller Repeat
VRRLKVPGVGAIADPAWSPDGKSIAFSGIAGGISDLYVYDLGTGKARQLTHDREAQLQPAWSPDGQTIAFATDAGDGTNFDRLTFGPMRLALLQVASGEVQLLPRFGDGKAINPQFSQDGASLYFVADRDGVSDIYRVTLADQALSRLSHVTTGVSGITALSPTLSVARGTGEVFFSVFDRGGFGIRALTARDALGVAIATERASQEMGLLPPIEAVTSSKVELALHDPDAGLPPAAPTVFKPYTGGLMIDYIGGPQVGVAFGGGYGTGLAGGVAFGFSDMLGNHVVQAVVQAQGSAKDLGGQVYYLNRDHRWNYGAEAYHIPLAAVYASYDVGNFNVGGQVVPGQIYTQVLQRVFYDQGRLLTQYPFSTTRRFELSAGVQRVSFNTEVDSLFVVGNTVLREARGGIPSGTGLTFATGSAALVGDNSFFGFTSPVAGGRYRVEVSPYVGSLSYETALADFRRYFFMRPLTVAFRGLHYGRYGTDSQNDRLGPLFVGQPTLIRGYDPNSFSPDECQAVPGSTDQCPQYTRLSGSRIAVANAELRIPLFGTDQLGLIRFPFLPTEISPFFDAGVAWSGGDPASFRFDRTTSDRVPVFSTGVSARINLLGFAVAEVYWAHPFQRPGRSSYIGFQLAPGW